MIGKYRGSAHKDFNISLMLTKKITVIIDKVIGYDNHLIIQEIGKFDVKIDVIPNGLDKHMAFTGNRNLVFIDSMQFMNSTLDTLIKNLSDNDLKSNCMFLSCHVRISEWIYTLYLPEYQGTPCSK